MWRQLSTALAVLVLGAEFTGMASERTVESPFHWTACFSADLVFRPFLDRMWQASPTFRQQCRRLAADRRVRVKVLQDDEPRRRVSSDARTVFNFDRGGLMTAEVYLRPSPDTPQLIAHEMEHILEQLDGVDLHSHASGPMVRKTDANSFETERAIEVGRRVGLELRLGAGSSRDGSRVPKGVGLMTLEQQDVDSTPLSARTARVSGSGRHVVFVSSAQLVEGDRNQLRDVYVIDLETRQLTLESLGAGAAPGNGESRTADISRDGRYVVFESEAGNLTGASFTAGTSNVFLRDRDTGTTRLLTTAADGGPANGPSRNPVISADGSTVVFESAATDLPKTGDAPTRPSVGIYLIRLTSGLRVRIDVSERSGQTAGASMSPAVSGDGRFVVFVSKADLTCAERSACGGESIDRNRVADIYLRDTETSTTVRMSRGRAGSDPDGPSYDPAISGDGRYVAFVSEATNLTRSSVEGEPQIYLHDRVGGTTELVSHTAGGRAAKGKSMRPALSFDGSRIAFQSLAPDLLCERKCKGREEDVNLVWDVFVHDRHTRRTSRVSDDGGDEWMEASTGPSIDHAGRVLAFGSRHPIDAADEDHDSDLFIRFLDQ